MTTAIAKTLSPEERTLLNELEPIIEKGLVNFRKVGEALAKISDMRLYRETHSTFKDYVEDKWKISVRTAYEHIGAAETLKALPAECANFAQTANAAQVREVAKVPVEKRAQVIKEAECLAESERTPLKARHIAAAAEEAESEPPEPPHIKTADEELAEAPKEQPSKWADLQPMVDRWFDLGMQQWKSPDKAAVCRRVIVKAEAKLREIQSR